MDVLKYGRIEVRGLWFAVSGNRILAASSWLLLLFVFSMPVSSLKAQGFQWKDKDKKVELLWNGKPVTAYCYFDSTEKPILFPVRTLSGITVTRGYPIAPRAGERTDHPHHAGVWFNYESVNGLDFWNNSDAIPSARKKHYGSIKHKDVLSRKASAKTASLQTRSHWVSPDKKVLLEEQTRFDFSVKGNALIIDRTATLKAMDSAVVFKDVKDGLIAIRVARWLEMPSTQKDKFVDAMGNETTVPLIDNKGVTGMYRNAQGVKGDSVWSTRSEWAALSGTLNNEEVTIVMIDHPSNPGYPAYWHARGYGLFAGNPLGAKVFSGGKAEMNMTMKKGETKTFRYRIVIHSGTGLSDEEINHFRSEFSK